MKEKIKDLLAAGIMWGFLITMITALGGAMILVGIRIVESYNTYPQATISGGIAVAVAIGISGLILWPLIWASNRLENR